MDAVFDGWFFLTDRRRKLLTLGALLVCWMGTLQFCHAQALDRIIIATTAFLICAVLSFLCLCGLRQCLFRRGLATALAVLGWLAFTLAAWLYFFTDAWSNRLG